MYPIVQSGRSEVYELICTKIDGVPHVVKGITCTRTELDGLIILQWPDNVALGEVEALHAELDRSINGLAGAPGKKIVSVIGDLGIWQARVGNRPIAPPPLDASARGTGTMRMPLIGGPK